MKRLFCLLILLSLSVVSVNANAEAPNLGSDLNVGLTISNENPVLPLVVSTSTHKPIFVDVKWALDVVKVTVDGSELSREASNVIFDTVNRDTFIPNANFFAYELYFDFITLGEKVSQGYKYYEFKVPDNFKSLSILYRLNYPDGTKSGELYELKAYANAPIKGTLDLFPH
jgi:hypothetical protein